MKQALQKDFGMRKNIKGVLNRDVTRTECPWLKEDLEAGTVVYEFSGHTYGVISYTGVPVQWKDEGNEHFFEVPMDAVNWEPGYVDMQRRMIRPKKD
jgi:hypothetical protein